MNSNGNFLDATIKYSMAIKVDGSNASFFEKRSICYLQLGELNLAVVDALKCIEMSNSDIGEFSTTQVFSLFLS